MSSPGLLRGFNFRGVRITGEDGRPFLVADSVQGALSPSALVRGDLVFSRVTVWRPRITLEHLDVETPWNVVAIFAPGEDPQGETPGDEEPRQERTEAEEPAPELVAGPSEEPDQEAPRSGGRTVLLRRLRIEDGSLNILYPMSGPPPPSDRVLIVYDAQGRPLLRRLSFRNIQLALDDAELASPDRPGQRFRVQTLSMDGQVWRDAFSIRDLQGTLTREGPGLSLTLDALHLPSSRLEGDVEVAWGGQGGVRTTAQG
ncbi:hypothetical protein ACFL3S_08560, partial [Gemmatimonadota bacterium]